MPEYMNYIKLLSEYKLEIKHSFHTKLNKWNQNVINFLARQKLLFSKIHYIIHIIYMYVYTSFSTMLDKQLRKNTDNKRWRNWETNK